ncbi:thioesterase domain-containing protein [Nisaea nitritireducens]|uniref:thioesterase domain-containing protein n=1 Tax=Nisaea nitritireducens TaxID=568392 RepID=UPI00186777DD|nr:thioesterase domain-containing protein [Nisaea nitritireducens]
MADLTDTPQEFRFIVTSQNKFLVSIRGKGARPPLYLVHSLAGELTWLPPLSQLMDDDQPIYGFAAAGLNAKGTAFDSVEEMAQAYLDATRRVHPAEPYILGGYSFGGVVAFEMARQVQLLGGTVEKLVLIDTYSPKSAIIKELSAWNHNGTMLQSVGNMLALEWKARALMAPGDLPAGDAAGQVDLTVRHLLTQCDIPHSYEALSDLLAKCRDVMAAHNKALSNYQPAPLPKPVETVLIQNSEGFVGRKNILNLPGLSNGVEGNDHGWDGILQGTTKTLTVETEHFLMMKSPALERVAEILNAEL